MKKLNFVIQIIVLVTILSMTGCDSGSSDPAPGTGEVSLYSAKINGTSLDDGLTNIPLNGNLEFAFSRTISVDAFKQAFSFSDAQGEGNYSVTLANAGSKANVVYSELNPESEYTISINTTGIGKNGEPLKTAFSRKVTTSQAAETKSACTTASESCMQQIEIDGATFDFYSSYDIISDSDYVWDDIEKVIFVVHGQNRDADNYFRYMINAIGDVGQLENTLIISPYFKEESAATSGELFWKTDWREGGDSDNSNLPVSSFTVLDKIVDHLGDQDKFPNLGKIYFAGHSSGAMLVQHYAITNKAETEYTNYDFEYIVANNQYFYYPDEKRYNESTGEFYTPDDCNGYDYWPYGFEIAPAYADGMTQDQLLNQQVTRKIIYLLGTGDTVTTGTLNTTDCAATLLGSNRLERGRNMFRYFETFYTTEHHHQKVEVEGIGHDAEAMFNSEEFKSLIDD